jgi:hypothetical protein
MVAALALTLLGLCGVASNASASYHLMKVREVSPGNGSPNTSYVEIQMYAPGQEFLSLGAKFVVCNSTCSILPAEFTGFSDVPQGANQSTVVVGDSAATSKDFTRDLNLESMMAGGAACYVSESGFSDCVSWGNFSANSALTTNYGPSADPGTPAPALTSGMALRRSISAGCPTALESSDDTNNSAADFAVTTPNPRPNSVAPTDMPCGSSAPPTGNPTQPGGPGAAKKKKKCKKRKRSSATPGTGSGTANPPAYAAKKRKCKKKRK